MSFLFSFFFFNTSPSPPAHGDKLRREALWIVLTLHQWSGNKEMRPFPISIVAAKTVGLISVELPRPIAL